MIASGWLTIVGRCPGSKNSRRPVTVRSRTSGRLVTRLVNDPATVGWLRSAEIQLRFQWRTCRPFDEPVRLSAEIHYHPLQRVDLGNVMNALCDVLEKAGVVKNDRRIRAYGEVGMLLERVRPRILVRLEPWSEALWSRWEAR